MQSPDANKADKPDSAIEGFLKQATQYKEFILLIVALCAAVFFVRDYFATKEDVRILQCQAQNGIALVEGKVTAEDLKSTILVLERQINEATQRKKSQKASEMSDASDTINTLNLELEQRKTDLASVTTAQNTAIANLNPGVCEGKAASK